MPSIISLVAGSPAWSWRLSFDPAAASGAAAAGGESAEALGFVHGVAQAREVAEGESADGIGAGDIDADQRIVLRGCSPPPPPPRPMPMPKPVVKIRLGCQTVRPSLSWSGKAFGSPARLNAWRPRTAEAV